MAGPSSDGAVAASESVYGQLFGADMEVFATQPAAPTVASQGPAVWLRVQSEGVAGADGYNLSYVFGTGLQFYRMVNSTFTQLGSTVVQVVAAGDSIGLSINGSVLEGWYKAAAGSWTSIGTQTDTNITGSGKIAASLTGGAASLARLDDFGGGSISGLSWITA